MTVGPARSRTVAEHLPTPKASRRAILCRVNDIPLRGTRVVRTSHGDIALFRTAENGVFALNDRCPHAGGPLSQGIVHGKSVTCPLHNWVISLETGKALGADKGQVPTIPLLVEDGIVSLDMADLPRGAPCPRLTTLHDPPG